MTGARSISVTLVPHTHWDREWYEPFAVFSERLVEMMDVLLDLGASGFPHFHLDGQTAMIDDYLERRPERAHELEALVRDGRLSAGPWFTQMDEFLTSGESHIRNLELGLRRADELGRALRVGYMPDQFGHIGQMPQILRIAGLERAMVWRGVPAEVDRSAFRWRSPDGSEVLTEYMVFGYFNGESFEEAVEPEQLAGALERSIEKMRPFLVGDRMVVMVGYDHAGPDATLPARLEAAAAIGGTRTAIGGLARHLEGEPAARDLPVWTGELRSSARAHLLPNVYSARVHQKRERGRVESLIERYAEPLAALVPAFTWPDAELAHAWKLLLWNGAHDSACGCSHDQVAIDVDARFAEVRATGESVVSRALASLGDQVAVPGTIRWNPSPFEREGVPGLGYAVTEGTNPPPAVPVSIEVLADRSGVAIDGIAVRLTDEPDVGDLYNYCYATQGQVPSPPGSIEIREGGFGATWPGLQVSLRVTRRADEPFLRLEGTVDNERPDHRLRLHVDLPSPVTGSVAGAPFELVARPLVGEGSEGEAASPTWPARHVAAAGRTAVLHEGVFEYEVVDGRALAVTVLRCVGRISAEVLATRPWDAGPATPTPDAQMIGRTAVSLGIWAEAPVGDPAALLAGWERFALPIAEATAAGGGGLPSSGAPLALELGDAQLSGVRRVAGVREARLWNPRVDRSVDALVDGRRCTLGPARIESLEVDPQPRA